MDDNSGMETILKLLQEGYRIKGRKFKLNCDPNTNEKWETVMEKNGKEKIILIEKELSLDEIMELNKRYQK